MEPFIGPLPFTLLPCLSQPKEYPLEYPQLSDILVGHLRFGRRYCQQILQQFRFRLLRFPLRILQEQQPQQHTLAFQLHLGRLGGHKLHIFHDQSGE